MSDIVERLSKAITTHANDDFSHPRTLGRERFCQRRLAMLDAKSEITRLRAKVAKADALARHADAQLAYMDLCDDKGDYERNLRSALAAYREADT